MFPSRRSVIAGAFASAAAFAATPAIAQPGRGKGRETTTADAPAGATAGALPASLPPLQGAYFRTWHDKAADPTRPNSIGEVPAEVDILFVFPDYTPEDSPFWTTLRDEYVPTLHARGTRVVRTTDIRAVLNPNFPNTAQGHADLAKHIVDTLVHAHGLDGLDIDMERDLTPEETARASAVFTELSKLIGPKSGTGKLFIYDTNRDGNVPLFQQTAKYFDYVLIQAYGRDPKRMDNTWATYKPYIKPEQFMPGFSFYEENDPNRWNDTSEPFEQSRAVAYADWQPKTGGVKAGVFSYAIDRDGKALGDNTITHTTYEWSKRIKQRMLEKA